MGNGVLKILGSGGCCPCDEVSGCDCDNACTLECRTRSGLATLCGWPAFTGTLGRRYKTRTVSGAIVTCQYTEADCPDNPCAQGYPHIYQLSGTSEETGPAGFQLIYSWSVEFAPIALVSGNWTYKLISAEVTRPAQFGGESGTVQLTQEQVSWGSTAVGGTISVAPCGYGGASYAINLSAKDPAEVGGNRVNISASEINLQAPPGDAPTSIVDQWDATCDYTPGLPGTCAVTETDNSQTYSSFGCAEHNANPIGALDGCGFDGETENLELATETATQRTWQGPGDCVAIEGGSLKVSGDVAEELSAEDTIDDAIGREIPAAWSAAGSCLNATAYATAAASNGDFTYQEAQVRAKLNAPSPSTTYQVTIRYWERPEGSSEPFLYLGRTDVLEVTTDADPETEEWTDWTDLPIEQGVEIRAGQCLIEEL